ncbi:hypothetical protein D3C80_1923720 [compost metagenome]
MLFLGFVIHLGFFLATGLLDRRVEDVFLQGGVDLQFLFNPMQQFSAFLYGTFSGRRQFFQQLFHHLVVLNQQIDSIHVVTSVRAG